MSALPETRAPVTLVALLELVRELAARARCEGCGSDLGDALTMIPCSRCRPTVYGLRDVRAYVERRPELRAALVRRQFRVVVSP